MVRTTLMHKKGDFLMSLSLVHSRALLGLEARPVCVEVHLANGLPSFTLVGLAETEVLEVGRTSIYVLHDRLDDRPMG